MTWLGILRVQGSSEDPAERLGFRCESVPCLLSLARASESVIFVFDSDRESLAIQLRDVSNVAETIYGPLKVFTCDWTETRPGFGRMIEGRYRLEQLDAARAISHAILPEVKQQSGFAGVIAAVDDRTGATVSLSLWTSEEAANGNVTSGWFQEQVKKFDDIYLATPTRNEYRVVGNVPTKKLTKIPHVRRPS